MRSSEPWTVEEDAVLQNRYCDGGSAACEPLLPNRSRDAITRRAARLNLRTRAARGKYRQFINRIDRDWAKLLTEIPEDTRTPGQRLMGEPIFERSALYQKQMEAQQ